MTYEDKITELAACGYNWLSIDSNTRQDLIDLKMELINKWDYEGLFHLIKEYRKAEIDLDDFIFHLSEDFFQYMGGLIAQDLDNKALQLEDQYILEKGALYHAEHYSI